MGATAWDPPHMTPGFMGNNEVQALIVALQVPHLTNILPLRCLPRKCHKTGPSPRQSLRAKPLRPPLACRDPLQRELSSLSGTKGTEKVAEADDRLIN